MTTQSKSRKDKAELAGRDKETLAARCQAVMDRIVSEGVSRVKEPSPRCPDCRGAGWAIVNANMQQAPIAMPCRVCNTVQHHLWTEGHLRGDGVCGCAACLGRRNGTITYSDHNPDGTLPAGLVGGP